MCSSLKQPTVMVLSKAHHILLSVYSHMAFALCYVVYCILIWACGMPIYTIVTVVQKNAKSLRSTAQIWAGTSHIFYFKFYYRVVYYLLFFVIKKEYKNICF